MPLRFAAQAMCSIEVQVRAGRPWCALPWHLDLEIVGILPKLNKMRAAICSNQVFKGEIAACRAAHAIATPAPMMQTVGLAIPFPSSAMNRTRVLNTLISCEVYQRPHSCDTRSATPAGVWAPGLRLMPQWEARQALPGFLVWFD